MIGFFSGGGGEAGRLRNLVLYGHSAGSQDRGLDIYQQVDYDGLMRINLIDTMAYLTEKCKRGHPVA